MARDGARLSAFVDSFRFFAQGVEILPSAALHVERVTDQANEAMREYVLDRPHSPTVYGLVAAMQGGRFTVDDLIDFINEDPDEDAEE